MELQHRSRTRPAGRHRAHRPQSARPAQRHQPRAARRPRARRAPRWRADPTVHVVTLTAAGRAFCAGADLRAVREVSPDPARWADFMGLWHRVFDRVEALPVPVIAGVHGLALAGGLELVLVADLVVADEEARLGDQHANFGLVAGRRRQPAAAAAHRRAPRQGADAARRLAHRAARPTRGASSIAWRRPGTLPRRSRRWPTCSSTKSGSADAHGQGAGRPRRRRRPRERARDRARAGGAHMRSADAAEGLAAFAEKRTPVFRAARSTHGPGASPPSRRSWCATLRAVRAARSWPRAPRTGTRPASSRGTPGAAWASSASSACASPRPTAGRRPTSSPSASPWRRSGAATSAAPTASSSPGSPARSSARSGTEEVKRRWLPPTASGEAVVALALTEPGAGSDAAQSRLPRRARRRRLRASPARSPASASAWPRRPSIVFARTSRGPARRGVTAFAVPLDLPGVSRSPLRDMGIALHRPRRPRVRPRARPRRRTGWARRAPASARSCRGSTTTGSASRSAARRGPGLARGDHDLREGAAGLRAALATFEGVSFPIAEAATHLEACRWLCYRALWLADRGRPLHEGIGDDEVVGAAARRGDHPPVPAPPRPLRLHRRAALRAAHARRDRASRSATAPPRS